MTDSQHEDFIDLQSQETTGSYVRWEKLEKLNDFITACGKRNLQIPKLTWEEYTEKTKKTYLTLIKECLENVIETLFPLETDIVTESFFNMNEKTLSGQNLDSQMIDALAASYQVAEAWQIKRQILSVIASILPYRELISVLPVSQYCYYTAQKHAVTQGCALPPAEKDKTKRQDGPKQA